MSGIAKDGARKAVDGSRGYLVALAWALGGTLLGAALIFGGRSDDGGRSAPGSGRAHLLIKASAQAPATPATRPTKNIEHVRVGDAVLAQDTETGRLAPKRVVEVYRRVSDHLRIVQIRSSDGSNQELKTTDEHPFWVPGTGWVVAGKLAVGQALLQDDGQAATVLATRREEHPEGVPVYNFQVEGAHTYFVCQRDSDSPILVHNDCYQRATEFLQRNNGQGQIMKLEANGLPYLGYNNELWQNHAVYISKDNKVYDIYNNGTPFGDWISKYMNDNKFSSIDEMIEYVDFTQWWPS